MQKLFLKNPMSSMVDIQGTGPTAHADAMHTRTPPDLVFDQHVNVAGKL